MLVPKLSPRMIEGRWLKALGLPEESELLPVGRQEDYWPQCSLYIPPARPESSRLRWPSPPVQSGALRGQDRLAIGKASPFARASATRRLARWHDETLGGVRRRWSWLLFYQEIGGNVQLWYNRRSILAGILSMSLPHSNLPPVVLVGGPS